VRVLLDVHSNVAYGADVWRANQTLELRSRHLLRPSFKLMTTIASAIPRHDPERQTRDNKPT